MNKKLPIHLFLFSFLTFPCYWSTSHALNIQVSIQPIHSIVAFICQGVEEPNLLITGPESPHTQGLNPSQIRSLQKADLVIWIGEEYESRWRQALKQHVNPTKTLTLIKVPDLTLYPYRHQALEHANNTHDSLHEGIDGHIWLDLHNVALFAKAIAEKLMNLDSQNQHIYQKNLQNFIKKIQELERQLKTEAQTFKKAKYLSYHDGLLYFDKFFGTEMFASLVLDPGFPPQAKDLLKLKKKLSALPKQERPSCVFTESGFNDTLSERLAAEFNLKRQNIDYIGYTISSGPSAFFLMMRQLMTDIKNGLS